MKQKVHFKKRVFSIVSLVFILIFGSNTNVFSQCSPDVTPPEINCPSNLFISANPGLCTASGVILGTPISTDNCLGTITETNNAPAIFSIGATTVVWTATDAAGNVSTCDQTITITENVLPVITCPLSKTKTADAGTCAVYITIPQFNGGCDIQQGFAGHYQPALWSTIYIMGDAGSVNTGGAPGSITIRGSNNLSGNPSEIRYQNLVPCNGTLSFNWSYSTLDAAPGYDPMGYYLNGVFTKLTTNGGGISQSGSVNIPVVNGDIFSFCSMTVDNAQGATSTIISNFAAPVPGGTAADNCGIASILNNFNNTNDASGNYPVGTTNVLWTVTDLSGNTASSMQTITVTDNENPTLATPLVTVTADAGMCSATSVNLGIASDNCGVLSATNNATEPFAFGNTTVTWNVTDINGNAASLIQTVTVIDDEDPSITCPVDVVVSADAGFCSASGVVLGTPILTDNCVGITTVINNAPAIYQAGFTTVIWTATDVSGNNNTCNQIVSVIPTYTFTETHSICSGQTYVWHGQNLNAAGTYYDNHTSIYGCDSTYTLNLNVNPVYAFTDNHSICEGEIYTWQDTDYTETNTYTASYLTVNGCDSIYTLNLTVNPTYAFTDNHSICEGETYNWQGSDYTEANTYTASYLTVNGCDSIYTLNLTVNPTYAFPESHSICQGDIYTWQGTDYTEANTYTANYLSVNGCDSIYTLNLTVNPTYTFPESHSICEGEIYTWQGSDYTEANTYTASYLSVNGCDSIYTLNLTVNPVYSFTESHSICEGETYTWQGTDYTEANTYTSSYLTVNGCDSVYTLNLTVNPVYAFTESHSICQGETYSWHGSDYTDADTYTASYTSQFGCDSIYTLFLIVNPVYAFTESHSICQGETYTWQGSDYTEANTYTANYFSVNGCDSIYTLNLTVNPTYTFEEMLTICEGETFEWQEETYTAGGYLQYQKNYESVFGCDSIYILHMNINDLPIVSIIGLDAQYCDNIPVVQLTGDPEGGVFSGPEVNGTEFYPSAVGPGSWEIFYTYSDNNECENFTSQTVIVDDCSGIGNEIASSVIVYPNPNSGDFTIALNESGDYKLAIYNSLGQIVWSQNVNMSEQKEFSVSGLMPGTYILKLVSAAKTDVLRIAIR